ncbi:MAG: NUDIX hydrolase [Candidatus Gastranaerophilales bacterium]|nr:NUDIX hydrolase [Candidatus Gastranaerophilales bacterium]
MKIISKTKYVEFKSTPSPSGSDWCYLRRTNDAAGKDSAVVITTLVKKDNEYHFLFLKTQRPPLYAELKSKYCLESPAGLIADDDCNENLIECAKKELLEEAGLKADKLYIELTNSAASAGLTSETLSYVTAVVENYNIISQPVSDGGIILERFLIPAKDVKNYFSNVEKDMSLASATVCGVFYALNRI